MRGALAVIFLHAGATKLLDPQAFAVLIDAYGIVPDALLMPVAVGLPLLEVVAAVGLMADIRGALAVIAALLVIFMAILVYGIRMGLDVDCGCFGPEDIEARAYHGLRTALVRDAAMLAGVIYLYGCRYCRSDGAGSGCHTYFNEPKKEISRWAIGSRSSRRGSFWVLSFG